MRIFGLALLLKVSASKIRNITGFSIWFAYFALGMEQMGFQFAGKAVYSAVWVAAVSLFMELLGFSTQKWLTAGGLGTVLITLAGREVIPESRLIISFFSE